MGAPAISDHFVVLSAAARDRRQRVAGKMLSCGPLLFVISALVKRLHPGSADNLTNPAIAHGRNHLPASRREVNLRDWELLRWREAGAPVTVL